MRSVDPATGSAEPVTQSTGPATRPEVPVMHAAAPAAQTRIAMTQFMEPTSHAASPSRCRSRPLSDEHRLVGEETGPKHSPLHRRIALHGGPRFVLRARPDDTDREGLRGPVQRTPRKENDPLREQLL